MEGKKSCVIYDSWGDLICNLPDELAGKLTKMILGYAFKGIETESDDPAGCRASARCGQDPGRIK